MNDAGDPLRLAALDSSPPAGKLAVVTVSALVLIAAVTWSALAWIGRESHVALGSSLDGRLENTTRSLQQWSEQEGETAAYWASNDQVVRTAAVLLGTDTRDLVGSSAQRDLRELLAPVLEAHDYRGFFVVGPDGSSLASMRDTNVGTTNLVQVTDPGRMARLLSGEVLVTVPQFSDVPLADESGNLVVGLPTMFVGAPVQDGAGQVIAVLLFRIDAAEALSDVVASNWWGQSGELFALDRSGRLLSPSRFEDELTEAGLVSGSSFQTLEVRAPVGGLATGSSGSERAAWPFTEMARSAMTGETGRNTTPYESYLGRDVVGSWAWVDELGYAVVAEQSATEALGVLRFTRLVVTILAAAAMTLVVAVIWLYFWWRPRLRQDSRHAMERAQRLHTVLNHSSDGLVIVGDNGKVVFCSEAAERLFDRSAHEIVGTEAGLILPGVEVPSLTDLPPNRNFPVSVAGGERRRSQALMLERADGSEFPAEISLSTIHLDENERLAAASIRDMTLDANLRRAEQGIRDLRRLTAVATHDLQEPLRKIEVLLSVLVESFDEDDDEEIAVSDRLSREVQGMRSLVSDLALYSSSAMEQPEFAPVDLVEILQDVEVEMAEAISRTSAELHVSPDLPTVIGDRRQLIHVFRSLVDNSLKYRQPRQPPCVRVGVEADRTGPGYWRIRVEDNGMGFEVEYSEQIFDMFRRLHSRGTHQGTGVGLAICRRIVEQHGGAITAQATPGEGAKISVVLPANNLHVNASC